MTKMRWISIVGVLALPLCALATEAVPTPRGIAPPTRIPDPAPVSVSGLPVATATMPRGVRRAVVADAARRFKVPENTVVLAQAEKITWTDGALGCPEPGQMYSQALVPGFRVVAKTSAGCLTYNTDSGGRVVTCGARGRNLGTSSVMDTEPRPYPANPAPEK